MVDITKYFHAVELLIMILSLFVQPALELDACPHNSYNQLPITCYYYWINHISWLFQLSTHLFIDISIIHAVNREVCIS